MNVLWGRVVVLGVVLLLVFLLGRATSSSSAEIEDLQERLSDREAEIDQLVAANREAAETTPDPTTEESPAGEAAAGGETAGESTGGTTTTTTPTPTVSPSASPSAAANTEAQTYTVRSGDNFSSISNRFYGSASFHKCIQMANQIADASSLQTGKSITIPPKPAAPCT
jgi:nucleoid-associated protein YgaU